MNFQEADSLVAHLAAVQSELDPIISQRYAGFLSVSVVAVFEQNVINALTEFAEAKNKVFGSFVARRLERLNASIKYAQLEALAGEFGEKYSERFRRRIGVLEERGLRTIGRSYKSEYGNLITCRHTFAHQFTVPVNSSFQSVLSGFESGKLILIEFEQSMKR